MKTSLLAICSDICENLRTDSIVSAEADLKTLVSKIMKLGKKNDQALDKVEAIYSDESSVTPFSYVEVHQYGRVKLELEVKNLLDSIQKYVPEYNGFSAVKFAAFIKKHKKSIYKIRFGREYSPVVYITTCVKDKSRSMQETIALGKAAMKMLKPDEFSIDGHQHVAGLGINSREIVEYGHDEIDPSYCCRLWFD